MKIQNNVSKQVSAKQISGCMLVMLLIGLSGCDWFSKDKKIGSSNTDTFVGKDSEVIVSMNGKPLITQASLQQEIDDLVESNPQFKRIMETIDQTQFKRNFTEGFTNQAIVDHYIIDKKIDQSEAYIKEMERMMRSVKHMLNTKFFSQNLVVDVSDTEARAFYDKNKECMPNLIIAQGGVKTLGLKFASEAKAKEFVAKVNELKGDFYKAAAAVQLKDKVQDFKFVNDQSVGIDSKLKDAIGGFTQFPTVEIIKVDDKTFWVVQALEKQEATYQPYEQIRENLIKMLQQEKRAEQIEKEVAKLRADYKVEIKEDYFGTPNVSKSEKNNMMSAQDDNDTMPVQVEDIDQESVYKE